jgi:hypothetical protein
MLNVSDYDLRKAPDPLSEPPRRRPVALWIAALVLIAGLAAAAYVVFGGWRGSQQIASESPAVGTQQQTVRAEQPLGGEAQPIDLPPLGEADPVVRELVRALSSHPTVAAWLTTDGLVRNFTVVVTNIADGRTPARHLAALRPSADFLVREDGEDLSIDPRSYQRYDTVADAMASIDPAGAAKLYATVKPRIEEAYGELGRPDTTFDRTLERALVTLLRTPVLDEPVAVEPHGIGYAYADPRVENLSATQKQFLRMGPANVRKVKAALREIALALGIPAERLP